MAYAMVAIGGIGFVVWRTTVHGGHVVGDRPISSPPHGVAVPTGVKIFSWIAPCGAARLNSALRCCGRRLIFLFRSAADRRGAVERRVDACCRHFYVVAHFHYVLSLGAVFRILRRLVLLVPEDVRLHVHETIARRTSGHLHRRHLVFFRSTSSACRHAAALCRYPMHSPAGPGVLVGSYISAFGVLIFIYGVSRPSAQRQAATTRGPGATTLNGRCRRRRRSTFEVRRGSVIAAQQRMSRASLHA